MGSRHRQHEKQLVLNRSKFDEYRWMKGWNNKELCNEIINNYGFDLSYNALMACINGKATWRVEYALAVIETLEIEIYDIFEWVKNEDIVKLEEGATQK